MQFDAGPIIQEIREQHRTRNYAMRVRKSVDLQLGSHLRTSLGWTLAKPADQRSLVAEKVATIVKTAESVVKAKRKFKAAITKAKKAGATDDELMLLQRAEIEDEDDPVYLANATIIMATIEARGGFDAIEDEAEARMIQLARQLPVWRGWGDGVHNFGEKSLACIIGEAGDLGNYPNPGTLWKRMGLAVLDDIRQGGLPKSASKEEWISHGYNAKRRSQMYIVGTCLLKLGPYREIYLRRKQYEIDMAKSAGLTIVPSAKIPAKHKELYRSDGHVHLRSQRYMERKFLRDLWRAWRREHGYGVIPAPWPDEFREAAE